MTTKAAPLQARWQALAPRERTLVALAAGLLALALLWWVALAPALAVLRAAPERHQALDRQLQRMEQLRAEAKQLQAQPRKGGESAMRQLEQATRGQLGASARPGITGDRMTVTLAGAAPQALAQWLEQARVDAGARPGEARLVRNTGGGWDGALVFTVPPAP